MPGIAKPTLETLKCGHQGVSLAKNMRRGTMNLMVKLRRVHVSYQRFEHQTHVAYLHVLTKKAEFVFHSVSTPH